jgi:hypothetical protein
MRKGAAKAILTVGFLLAWVLALPLLATAQDDPYFEYAPEKFGVSLGQPQQQVLKSMAGQGFSFAPGGRYLFIKGAKDVQEIFDVILVVGEEQGSLDIWQSNKVILGFKANHLALVEEITTFNLEEADTVFEELVLLFDGHMNATYGDSVEEHEWSAEQVDFSQKWAALFWFAPVGAVEGNESQGRYRAWREGNRLTALSVQPAINAAGKPSADRKTVLIQHVDWCAFPLLDSFLENSDFQCPFRKADE